MLNWVLLTDDDSVFVNFFFNCSIVGIINYLKIVLNEMKTILQRYLLETNLRITDQSPQKQRLTYQLLQQRPLVNGRAP